MKKIIYFIASAVLMLTSFSGNAQQNNLRTAYFLDGYTYRYRFNPSFAPERGFVSIPVLGSINLGVESSLSLSDFYFPTSDGKLRFFMDDAISNDQFMKGIKKRNILSSNVNVNPLSFGFRTGKAYHTVDLSLKAYERSNLPESLFSFAKVGTSEGNTSWDISRLGLRVDTYAELAYGYSRSISDALRVGARLKLLFGVVRADIMVDNLNLSMTKEKWEARTAGHAAISGPVHVGTQEGSNLVDFNSIVMTEEYDDILNNIGFALDLGASYDFLEYFTASAALLDLGMISWANTTTAAAPTKSWIFEGFGTIDPDEGSDIGDELSNFGDNLLDMIQFEKEGSPSKKSYALAATMNLGIEARMPFYERLSFGLLATHRFEGAYSWTEGRLSANLAPVNSISLAASCAYSNFGASFGGVVNFHLPGFNLFLGMDSFTPLFNLTPDYIPAKSMNTNLALGLNILFGKPQGRYRD